MIIRLLFERAWLLAIILVVVQFFLIALWSWRRGRLTARGVWIGFAMAPLMLLTSRLVETDREAIMRICEELAAGFEAEDDSVFRRHLADDLLGRTDLIEALHDAWESTAIYHPQLSQFKIGFRSDHECHVEFKAHCRFESRDFHHPRVVTKWRLVLRTSGRAWRVQEVEPIPIPPLYLKDLDAVLRRAN